MTRHGSYSAPGCAVAIALALLLSPEASLGQASGGTDDPVSAARPRHDWEPPPPMPDDAAWIQLTSGEWLKGEIVSFFRGTLVFDSDKLGEQRISLGDVREIRSAHPVEVALEGGGVASGKLFLDEETVRVMGEQDQEYTRSELLSITPAASGGRRYWAGTLTSGLNIRSGNSDETDFTARADIERRAPKARLSAEYLGNLSETRGERTADSHRALAGWARMVSRQLFWSPLWGEYFRDPFSNISSRWTVGTGLGYLLRDSSSVDWEVVAGVGYQRINFADVLEGEAASEETPALIIGTGYDIELTTWLDYSLDLRFTLTSEEAGSYTHHLITGLAIDIVGSLDFDISLVWDHIEDPTQNADGSFPEQDDFQLVFGLGYSF